MYILVLLISLLALLRPLASAELPEDVPLLDWEQEEHVPPPPGLQPTPGSQQSPDPGAAPGSPGRPPTFDHSKPVSGQEAGALNDYGRRLGLDLLRDYFHVDVDSLQSMDFSRFFSRWSLWQAQQEEDAGGKPAKGKYENTAAPSPGMDLQVRIEQVGDALRLRDDPRDIPFAFRMDSVIKLVPKVIELKTYAFLPLSYRDEIKVGTSWQLPDWHVPYLYPLLTRNGFTSRWTADAYFSNREGDSFVDAGLGTQFYKTWTFFYRYRYDISDDSQNSTLSLGTTF